MRSPAGKCFQPKAAAAGKKIQYLCVLNIELNHAEHGFLHPVESRARVSALRCIESPAASRTCNNTQFQSSEYNILILPLSKGEFQPPMQYFRTKSELFFRLTHFLFLRSALFEQSTGKCNAIKGHIVFLNGKAFAKLEIVPDADRECARFLQQAVVISAPLSQPSAFLCECHGGNDNKIDILRKDLG